VEAAVVREWGRLEVQAVPDPKPMSGEVVVELRAAALNRRDLAVVAGRGGDLPRPFVPGSDGAGTRRDTGEEVVVFPSLAWGGREDAPGPEFRILGGQDDGTYAELIAIPEDNLFPKPQRFSWHEAAALPLAGLTAYRALFSRGGLRTGETVLVLGAGGGVATFAVQLAAQAGARVLVTSSSEEKIERARELGAKGGVSYRTGDWAEELAGTCDLVVDSVGSTWPQSLRCLKPGGRLVVFGATGGAELTLSARAVYSGQWSILGTTMGSPRDFAGLLDAVERGEWRPVVDSVRPLADVAAAHARMAAGEQFGKLVLETV
jgi:NADPH:quinone reductase-like Zn-dependent oxidoreductase